MDSYFIKFWLMNNNVAYCCIVERRIFWTIFIQFVYIEQFNGSLYIYVAHFFNDQGRGRRL